MSTEYYKRGYLSPITHLAGRPEGAGAIYVQAKDTAGPNPDSAGSVCEAG